MRLVHHKAAKPDPWLEHWIPVQEAKRIQTNLVYSHSWSQISLKAFWQSYWILYLYDLYIFADSPMSDLQKKSFNRA